jgi:hypothetical protein
MVEEQRRDNPNLNNRVDIQAEEMGTPTDPEAVLEAIKDVHEELDTSASSDNLHEPDAKAG